MNTYKPSIHHSIFLLSYAPEKPIQKKIGSFFLKIRSQTEFQIASLTRQTLFYWLYELFVII
ncbi:uncharacterized protein DS421_12g379950 [Arachis hypogaea]|nr:uncharacterized protein DS421_12g379950 [Arachis hypogaea]